MANVQLGLWQNRKQFWLLVLVNALVGGMIGLERSILPQLAQEDFGITSHTVILSFILVFGLAKAVSNYVSGVLANRWGRKAILVAGWVVGFPVPFILAGAGSWSWIIVANILLGMNQGLAWSSTVVMKIDLVGERQRGFAMGLNEFAGYIALALSAMATAYLAGRYGLRPYPFYLGIGLSVAGLFLSVFYVRDTLHYVRLESGSSSQPILHDLVLQTTWRHPNLSAVTQAGFVNNLNDALVWGLLPMVLAGQGYSLKQVGLVMALYPAVWGISQLFTGSLSDRICKKDLLFWGMLVQGLALLLFLVAATLFAYAAIAILLGIGTAIVYPTFLSAVAEEVHPQQRSQALGTFRFWRDFGYVVGAALTGLLADFSGKEFAIFLVGLLTLSSAVIIHYRMRCAGKQGRDRQWMNLQVKEKKGEGTIISSERGLSF